MGHTIDRRRPGTIKENKAKLTRILEQLRATKQESQDGRIDGRKLPAEDLVWLANDELRRIKKARHFDRIWQEWRKVRKALATARKKGDATSSLDLYRLF